MFLSLWYNIPMLESETKSPQLVYSKGYIETSHAVISQTSVLYLHTNGEMDDNVIRVCSAMP